MSNFEPNAILRGAQLTLVGAYRALQNPSLFKHEHYKQVVMAMAAGILMELLMSIPVFLIKLSLYMTSFFVDLDRSSWEAIAHESVHFLQHSVLQIPFFLMTLMKHLSPALDNMFMESLEWVDKTYLQKHKAEDPSLLRALYYPNLKMYESERDRIHKSGSKVWTQGLKTFLKKYGNKAAISLAVYLLTFLPRVGKLVLPISSFYIFNQAVGTPPAIAIFAVGALVSKKSLIIFLQTYFSSRSMMRELLQPYFGRIKFNREQKREWLVDREGVLFGFGVGFFVLLKIPFIGVLIYGIAEASTAYLITKITDPPPPPKENAGFVQSQMKWKNKKEFLSLPFDKLDRTDEVAAAPQVSSPSKKATELPEKKFS